MESATYSIRETAERLGIGLGYAYRLAHADELPVPILRIGSLMKVRRVDLESFLGNPPTTEGN